jgi:diphthamide biosynthesis protein 2
LVEDDTGYWRPVITPFELEVALMSEEERVWGGEWWGGIEKLGLNDKPEDANKEPEDAGAEEEEEFDDVAGGVEGEESAPPEFDMRTGRLISSSRPMRLPVRKNPATTAAAETSGDGQTSSAQQNDALIKRSVGELASINGVASPGAEFLRSGRTWQGLGTDFDNEASTLVEEGRSGVARGYQVGESGRH